MCLLPRRSDPRFIPIPTYAFGIFLDFYKVPELASLGRVFRSAVPVELTESETEYVVRCVKHIMDAHVVLDFTVSNTIEEQVLNFTINLFKRALNLSP